MKALILSAWEDTGGVGIALKKALEKHTEWEARFVHRHHNYIGYETDIYWEPGAPKPDGLDELFREADVVHIMERWTAVQHFTDWLDKPLVMHHHGTEFRVDNTRALLRETKEFRAVPIVSTIDLTLIDPEAEWLPNPCDIDAMVQHRTLPTHARTSLRVAHSPTNRALKGTEFFLSVADQSPFSVDLIEGVPWSTGLARKGQADIVYDQFHIGYALSGIEAMAMGIPVIGGVQDPRIIELMMKTFGYLPFLLADEGSLRERLMDLCDHTLRAAYSHLGTHHVRIWHDEYLVANRLVKIYERAMACR
jgi:hypothetical protein